MSTGVPDPQFDDQIIPFSVLGENFYQVQGITVFSKNPYQKVGSIVEAPPTHPRTVTWEAWDPVAGGIVYGGLLKGGEYRTIEAARTDLCRWWINYGRARAWPV